MNPPSLNRPSLADLFIANLRLLDLHHRADWPNITLNIYAVKDLLGQNQKTRIRCTEWALYRLFELWDAEETNDKLQPFFPVLEPLQSINLRAAIFRWLNDLKKIGQLGRETIVRKTMLDECKGDKFLEVLVAFSTPVVRKIAVPQSINHGLRRPVAQQFAENAFLEAHQSEMLGPLVIAHRVSLSANLQMKSEVRMKCQKFAGLLDQKSQQLSQRAVLCNEASNTQRNEDKLKDMEKHIKENWPGNSRWPRALLYGDDVNPGDQPLKQPFPQVWNVIISGDALQSGTNVLGLKQELEHRITQQQTRLQKWRAFYADMSQTASQGSSSNSGTSLASGNEFNFQEHQSLHLSKQSKRAVISSGDHKVTDRRLKAILADLTQELDAASRPEPKVLEPIAKIVPDSLRLTRSHTLSSVNIDTNRPISLVHHRALSGNLGLGRSSTAIPLNRVFSPAKKFRLNARSASATSNDSNTSASTTNASISERPVMHERAEPTPPPTPKVVQLDYDFQHERIDSPVDSGDSTVDEADALSSQPEDNEADGIIASIMNAFSPTSDTNMSLAERTRQSMSQVGIGGQLQNRLQPFLARGSPQEAHPAAAMIAQGMVAERRTSLLERTQQSMGHLTVDGQSRSRKSLSVRKSRASIAYPINQFETPGRPRPEPLRNTTPNEKLFAAEADYTSVFKSRPRIACSPQPSPMEDDLPQADGIIYEEAEENSMIDDIDGDSWIRSSPLRGRG